MNKSDIARFIRENRSAIKAAPVDQKIRILKVIRESLEQDKLAVPTPPPSPPNSDYLEER